MGEGSPHIWFLSTLLHTIALSPSFSLKSFVGGETSQKLAANKVWYVGQVMHSESVDPVMEEAKLDRLECISALVPQVALWGRYLDCSDI